MRKDDRRAGDRRRIEFYVKKLLLLSSLLIMVLAGCASKAVRREIVDVRSDPRYFQVETIPLSSQAERVDPTAYSFYVDAVIYEALGNSYQATESYRKALRYYSDSYEIRFSLAENLYRMQRFDDALIALDPIAPADADVWEMRGDIYRGNGEIDSAMYAYRQAVEQDSLRFEIYSYLATMYARGGEIPNAAWAFQNLGRIDPENYAVWYELGRLQLRMGQVDSAQIFFRRSTEIRSDAVNAMALIGLGEIYEANEQLDSALAIYQRAAAADSTNILTHRNLAGIYVKLDSLEAATRHAQIESNLAPLDRQSSRRLGMLYFYLDSLRVADSVFTALVQSGERTPVNHQYLGRIALRLDQVDRALTEFRQVVQMAGSDWENWFDLGLAYRTANQRDNEIDSYRSGLELVADTVGQSRLMMALGSALEQTGRFESAVATFEKLIKLAPEYDVALNYLGYMLADSGQRLDYAEDLIEKALKISPDNAAYLDSYGWVKYRRGDYDDARKYLERAVELDSDPTMFDHLGDTYLSLGKPEEARRWWRKALELDPKNEAIRAKLDQ